jgi:class 3 adenylate cyclase
MDALHPSVPHFRKLLDDVQGSSEFVIAVIFDVRGFTSFAMKVESAQTVAFLKRVYLETIDRYFGNASYIKPTGDGLLMAFPYDESNLRELTSSVVKSSLACVADFPRLCDGDDMINFDTPDKVGIGISRGAATKVLSHESIIDYSGRPFNIASRLMDLARPRGVILDSRFGENLIPSDVRGEFSTADVYLRGITNDTSTKIYYSKDATAIQTEKTELRKPIT